MRPLSYLLLALSLFFLVSWATVYSRDNSVFVARGSMPLTVDMDSEMSLWLLEGYVNMSLFVPLCNKLSLIVYSKGSGSIIYRLNVEALDSPLREVYMFKTPHPGFYSIQAKMRPIEGCEAPRVNGVLNVFQYAQPEQTVRTILLASTTSSLALALTYMVYQQLKARRAKS